MSKNTDFIRGFDEGYEAFAEKVVVRMVIGFMERLKELSQGDSQTFGMLKETAASTFATFGLLEEENSDPRHDVTAELLTLINECKK